MPVQAAAARQHTDLLPNQIIHGYSPKNNGKSTRTPQILTKSAQNWENTPKLEDIYVEKRGNRTSYASARNDIWTPRVRIK